jgi:hypothetical protein
MFLIVVGLLLKRAGLAAKVSPGIAICAIADPTTANATAKSKVNFFMIGFILVCLMNQLQRPCQKTNKITKQ